MALNRDLFSKHPILLPSLLAAITLLATILTGYALSGQKTRLYEKKVRLEERKRDLALLDRILADYETHKVSIEAAVRTLPKTYEDVSFVVSQIERLAKANRQELETQLEKDAQKESGELASLKITLKTSGSYTDFSQLMSGLALLPYHTRLDTLQIDEAGGNVETVATIRLYLQKE